jgi:hypothetical protein
MSGGRIIINNYHFTYCIIRSQFVFVQQTFSPLIPSVLTVSALINGDYDIVLGCNAVWTCKLIPTIHRNILLRFSRLKLAAHFSETPVSPFKSAWHYNTEQYRHSLVCQITPLRITRCFVTRLRRCFCVIRAVHTANEHFLHRT